MTLPPDCPPTSAESPQGIFYRLAHPQLSPGERPPAEDWILPHAKRKGDCAGRTDLCRCHAHSLFSELSDAVRVKELIPALRRKTIAEIELSPDMGMIEATPSDAGDSHHDWWPAEPELHPTATVVEAHA